MVPFSTPTAALGDSPPDRLGLCHPLLTGPQPEATPAFLPHRSAVLSEDRGLAHAGLNYKQLLEHAISSLASGHDSYGSCAQEDLPC